MKFAWLTKLVAPHFAGFSLINISTCCTRTRFLLSLSILRSALHAGMILDRNVTTEYRFKLSEQIYGCYRYDFSFIESVFAKKLASTNLSCQMTKVWIIEKLRLMKMFDVEKVFKPFSFNTWKQKLALWITSCDYLNLNRRWKHVAFYNSSLHFLPALASNEFHVESKLAQVHCQLASRKISSLTVKRDETSAEPPAGSSSNVVIKNSSPEFYK